MVNLSDFIGERNTFNITSPSGRYDKAGVEGTLEFGFYKMDGKFIKTDPRRGLSRGGYVLFPVEDPEQESVPLGLEGLHFIYEFKGGIHHVRILDEDLFGENPLGDSPAEITSFLEALGEAASRQR